MNARSLATLAALVAIVLAAAVWVSTSRDHQPEKNAALYPTLKSQLDGVKAVRIYGAGNRRKVELVRSQNDWRIKERFDYPAAGDKLRQLVLDLGAAKPVEEKTSNPANYAALGVEDVTATGASGVRVELVGPTAIDLIVGKPGPGTQSRYIRKAGEKQSWLVDRALEAPSEPKDWLDSRLIDVAADRIHSAQIEIEGKQPYTAAKAQRSDANFAVTGLKKAQTLNTESAANGIGSALANLTLEDVAPYTDWQNKPAQAKAVYRTFDGTVIELSGWTEGNVHRIHARARYDEPLAAQFAVKSDDKNKDRQKQSGAPDRKAEAAALDARLQAWVFQIPDYKYGSIFTPLDELLKK